MKLRFHVAPGHMPQWPGPHANGQAVPRIGRDMVPGDADKGTAAKHPAQVEPVEVDSEDAAYAPRARKLCARGSLLPADKATAEACGVPFVELARVDDEWQPKATAKARAAKDAE